MREEYSLDQKRLVFQILKAEKDAGGDIRAAAMMIDHLDETRSSDRLFELELEKILKIT